MKKNPKNISNIDIIGRVKLLMNYNPSMTLDENVICTSSNNEQIIEQKKPTTASPSYLTVEPSTFQWNPQTYGSAGTYSKTHKTPLMDKNKVQTSTVKKEQSVDVGLKIEGPFTMSGKPWIDKTIVFNDENEGNGYYYLYNNSKVNLKINSVTSNFQEGKITTTFYDGEIKPKSKVKIYVKILEQSPESTTMYDNPLFNKPDNTSVRKNIPSVDIKKPQNNTIYVNTNLGITSISVKYGYNQNRVVFDDMVTKLKKRLSIPGGYKVPEGFSPFNYDDFLKEFKNLCEKCPSLRVRYNKLLIKEQSSVTGMPVTNPIPQKEVDCERSFQELKNLYYNEKFPHGITPDDNEDFNEQYSSVNSEITNFKKQHMVTRMREPYDQVFDESRLNTELQKKYRELINKSQKLERDYGYDVRTTFDQLMDGTLGHIMVNGAILALFIAGFVTEGATWVMASELLLNVSLGSYYTLRGNPREGFLFFMFAGLSQFHAFYNLVGSKVAKFLPKKDIEVLSKSIANKIGTVTLSSQEELMVFMNKILTKSEKKLFKEVINQSKNSPDVLKNSLSEFAEKIANAKGLYRDMSWYKAEKLLPQLKKFGTNVVIDFAVTLRLIRGIYDEIKKYFKTRGVDITWGQRDNEILEFLAEHNTESELKKLKENIMSIVKQLNDKEVKIYGEELSNTTVEEISKYPQYTQSDIDKKVNEIKEKNKKNKVEAEKQSQLTLDKISDPEYQKQTKDRWDSYPTDSTIIQKNKNIE